MKTSTWTTKGVLIAKNGPRVRFRLLLRKLRTFLAASFESDWEEKTGLPWQEWGKCDDNFLSKSDEKKGPAKAKVFKLTVLGLVVLLWIALMTVESYQPYNQLIFSPIAVRQEESSNRGSALGQSNVEQATLIYDHERTGESMKTPHLLKQGVGTAPFAEDRFSNRPTRTGGMPTIRYPKGVPYSESASLLASWLQGYKGGSILARLPTGHNKREETGETKGVR